MYTYVFIQEHSRNGGKKRKTIVCIVVGMLWVWVIERTNLFTAIKMVMISISKNIVNKIIVSKSK